MLRGDGYRLKNHNTDIISNTDLRSGLLRIRRLQSAHDSTVVNKARCAAGNELTSQVTSQP